MIVCIVLMLLLLSWFVEETEDPFYQKIVWPLASCHLVLLPAKEQFTHIHTKTSECNSINVQARMKDGGPF